MLRALVAVSLLVACADTKDEPDSATTGPSPPLPVSAAPVPAPEPVAPPPPPPDAPPTEPRPDAAPGQESEPIDVILEGGTIKIGRRRVTEAQLVAIFEKAAARDPRTQIIVKVLGAVSRARKDKVVHLAEGAGLERVGTMELDAPKRKKKKPRKRR